jgi:predicted kinase
MKLQSLQQPHAIVMVGIPGSGKSFFADKFAAMFDVPHINLAYIAERASTPETAAELAYSQLVEILKTKGTVLLELSTDTRTSRTEIAKLVKQAGYAPLFVWTQVDLPTAKKRTLKSKSLTKSEFDVQIKQFSPPHSTENALVISGKHTYTAQARAVLRRLTEPRAAAAQSQRPAPRETSVNSRVRIQ